MTAHTSASKLADKTLELVASRDAAVITAQNIALNRATVLQKIERQGAAEARGAKSKMSAMQEFRTGCLDGTFKHDVSEAAAVVEAYAKGYDDARDELTPAYAEASKAPFKSHLMSFGNPAVRVQDWAIYAKVVALFVAMDKDARISGSAFNAMYVVNGEIIKEAATLVEGKVEVTDAKITAWLTAKDKAEKKPIDKLNDAIKSAVKAGKADAKYARSCEAAADILKSLVGGKVLPDALISMISKLQD